MSALLRKTILILFGTAISWTCLAGDGVNIERFILSSDVHSSIFDGSVVNIATDDTLTLIVDATGTIEGANLAGTFDQAGVDGFHQSGDGCGQSLFSLDATAEAFGQVMRPADVFNETGVKVFDSEVQGVPVGVNVDALSRNPVNCDLVLSIDVIAELGASTYGPGDLISWNATDGFSLLSSAGANVSSLHVFAEDNYLFSVDTRANIAGESVDRTDIIERTLTGSFQTIARLSEVDSSWEHAVLDALWAKEFEPLPEPIFSDGFEG